MVDITNPSVCLSSHTWLPDTIFRDGCTISQSTQTRPEPDGRLVALGQRWSSAIAKVRRLGRVGAEQDDAIMEAVELARAIAAVPARTVRGAAIKLRLAVHEAAVAAGSAADRDANWTLVDEALAALLRAPAMEGAR